MLKKKSSGMAYSSKFSIFSHDAIAIICKFGRKLSERQEEIL